MSEGDDIRVLFPRIRPSDGALVGTVQLLKGGRLIFERSATLSQADAQAEIVAALADKGLQNPEPELIRLIQEARVNLKDEGDTGEHKPIPSRYQGQARWVVDQLEGAGRFLSTAAGTRFFFNGTTRVPVPVLSWQMQHLLWQRFQVNPHQDVAKYLSAHIDHHAHEHGDLVVERRFSHYESASNTLYVDCGAGTAVRVTAEGTEKVENGTDAMLFFPSSYQAPWEYEPTERDGWRLGPEVVDTFSFIDGEDTPLAPHEQSHLFLLWLTSMFFRSEMPTRPIGLLVGETGSGKSAAVRTVGRVLYGPDFELNTLGADKEDDFWVLVCNDPFVAYDNADTRVKWLEDALATCATGVQQSRRQLYTEFGQVVRRPDTFLALTARTPRFRRADVSSRLLIFQLAPRHLQNRAVLGELVLHQQTADARNALMSELVDRCRLALTVPPERPQTSPLRLADFYAVAHRVGISLGLGPETHEILEKLRGLQHEFAAEENTLVLTLEAWLERSVGGQPNGNRALKARTLHAELGECANDHGYRYGFANEVSLGRALSELGEAVEERLSIAKTRGREGIMYRIRPAEWTERERLL